MFARGNAMYNQVDGVVVRSGNINGSETWTRNNAYFLSGAGQRLRPGGPDHPVRHRRAPAPRARQGTLVIRQGARINAIGTEDLPIIMTSELPVGQRAAGDWGGSGRSTATRPPTSRTPRVRATPAPTAATPPPTTAAR